MGGGFLNIISEGSQNIILNGNPSKTFFKCVYAKYTNFGLQKIRIDYDGLRELRLNEESKFTFKVPKHADLLMDSYVALTLPTIWSPIYPPQTVNDKWKPYEFKWIKNLGTTLIKEITISVGGQVLQQFTGSYLHNVLLRDNHNIALFNEMVGNVKELNDPGNAFNRNNQYPNAYYTTNTNGCEPSIKSRVLYIPLGAWFTHTSKIPFPLVCLQYNQLTIEVTIRPIRELFVVNNILSDSEEVIQPNFNTNEFAFYRFIQEPPDTTLSSLSYSNKSTSWNADVHLICNYGFLSPDEGEVFAQNTQEYLIKEVKEDIYKNIVGSKKIQVTTNGLISNWMWFFRRSDVNLRNEWTNYTNWKYDYLPNNVIKSNSTNTYTVGSTVLTPDINPDGTSTDLYISGDFSSSNDKYILNNFALLFDGKYRENDNDAGIYNYLEKYRSSYNNAYTEPGLYCYNFNIKTSLKSEQPDGAINLSKFKNIDFELTTIFPSLNPNAQFYNICDEDGEVIGVNKLSWDIYEYTYDFHLFEERYNLIIFSNGNVSKKYAN